MKRRRGLGSVFSTCTEAAVRSQTAAIKSMRGLSAFATAANVPASMKGASEMSAVGTFAQSIAQPTHYAAAVNKDVKHKSTLEGNAFDTAVDDHVELSTVQSMLEAKAFVPGIREARVQIWRRRRFHPSFTKSRERE
ncbi:hypothetical protein Ae201684P_019475 [Aphanomyces euteiches]|uniref:Uncharacterized protein n=1 Tax=Aphanomyces euteiches TaxID=100861 RepID=A0A6G0XEW0_9STRA|nr:hypothetical protein Ae201684_005596 [Aphanomyces euteiches]KAH9078385.1 hypothetical protein Ae201684P_019475 [Aphanomyces euteiches]